MLLAVATLISLIALPTAVNIICSGHAGRWYLHSGTIRAGVLLLTCILWQGMGAAIGELAGTAGIVLFSGKARTLLVSDLDLRSWLIHKLAAAQTTNTELMLVQYYLLIKLGKRRSQRDPA